MLVLNPSTQWQPAEIFYWELILMLLGGKKSKSHGLFLQI
jgi:hypothetical protein